LKSKILNLLNALLLGVGVSVVGGFLQAGTFKIFITIPWGCCFTYLFFFTQFYICEKLQIPGYL